MNDHISEEMLSAYVDGELTPAEHARVADAIADDPHLADRVATLSRVKFALSGLAAAPAQPIHLPSKRWSKAMMAVAASVGLFVAIMSGVLTGQLHFGGDDAGWYAIAAATHGEWTLQPAAPNAREVDANLYLASVDRLRLPVYAPDLTDARLRLTYIRFLDSDGAAPAAIHLGYTGRHGCRVTLWVTAADKSMGAALTETRDGKRRGFRWRAGKVAYALFATGMAEQRFTTIADKVYEATSESHGFDDEMRMALNEATRTAPPCAA